MPDDDNVTKSRLVDIGDHGIHEVRDMDGRQIRRLGGTPGEVHREDTQFRCLSRQFGDRWLPAIGGVRATVYEHQAGQCHPGSLAGRKRP